MGLARADLGRGPGSVRTKLITRWPATSISRSRPRWSAIPDTHLKDLIVDHLGREREMEVDWPNGVINFGSDSFLGLDQDPRVQAPSSVV